MDAPAEAAAGKPEHWLTGNLRTHLAVFDRSLSVQEETALRLGDREIVRARLAKTCRTVVRTDDEVLHEGPPREVTVCRVVLNTGSGVPRPIDCQDVHPDAGAFVKSMLDSLARSAQGLLTNSSTPHSPPT